MEEIVLEDFDQWIKKAVAPKEEYCVTYSDDGVILGVHPFHEECNLENPLKIDNNIAIDIFNGIESIASYKVDIANQMLIKLNRVDIVKIDDILHRIIDKKWSTIENPDIVVEHNAVEKTLSISMNEKYKDAIWNGDPEITFLITGYNDPNILKYMISLRVDEISKNKKNIDIDIDGKFSVYTRRIFKDYIFETV